MYESEYFKKANKKSVKTLLDAGLARTYELKRSLLDQAKENLSAKHTENDFNNIVGKEYEKIREASDNGIRYLKEQINKDPEAFDNHFRNMESFVRA